MISRITSNVLLATSHFLINYRRTVLGPIWLLVGPSLFIISLGFLFAEVGSLELSVFIPHLSIGLVLWSFAQTYVTASATVFQRNRPQIMQGSLTLSDVVTVELVRGFLTFLHQLPIVIIVMFFFPITISWSAIMSLIGLIVVIINGIWVIQVFGILGTRYRDLSEIVHAIMRIAFLATPIIWIPGTDKRGVVMEAFLLFNPFYHFIEVIRAPLLGGGVSVQSWIIVIVITLVGTLTAHLLVKRYGKFVSLWI